MTLFTERRSPDKHARPLHFGATSALASEHTMQLSTTTRYVEVPLRQFGLPYVVHGALYLSPFDVPFGGLAATPIYVNGKTVQPTPGRGTDWEKKRTDHHRSVSVRRPCVVLFNPAAEQVLHIPASFALDQQLSHLREYHGAGVPPAQAKRIYNGLYEGLKALGDEGKSHSRTLDLAAPPQTIAMNFASMVRPDGIQYGSVITLREISSIE
jgi:hypothetical protein